IFLIARRTPIFTIFPYTTLFRSEADSLAFLSLLNDETVANNYGFTQDNFFSMFIPNTYQIYWNTNPTEIIDRFSKEYAKFWSPRSEEHTFELQSRENLVCRLLLE